MEIDRYKKQLDKLFEENEAVSVYIFGSYAKGDISPLSDVDIAILLSRDIDKREFFNKKLKFNNEIVKILHQNKVDILILNEAFPSLKFHVITEGVVIFDKDPVFRYDFEARTLVEYIDTKPLRKEYNKSLFEKVKMGGFL